MAVAAVLLVAYVFVQRVHAQSLDQAQTLSQSQQETSKIKTQLEDVKSEKTKLTSEVQVRDEKIKQLETENSELKE